MAKPLFREERGIEEDGCDAGAGDKERFEGLCAYVGNVGNTLGRVHGGIVWSAYYAPV